MSLEPIQTHYKGYHFRSRTEARWAVFFDVLGWDWEYEVEGFKLKSGWYLPDFWFPSIGCYAEVKKGALTAEEFHKCLELSFHHRVILLEGPPDFRSYRMLEDGELLDTVMVPMGNKFFPFFYTVTFDQEYFDDVLEAITEARSKRFEFHGK